MSEMGRQLVQRKARRQLLSNDFPVALPVIVIRIIAWFLPRRSEKILHVFCWHRSLAFPGFCCLQDYRVIFQAVYLAFLEVAAGSFPLSFPSSKGQF